MCFQPRLPEIVFCFNWVCLTNWLGGYWLGYRRNPSSIHGQLMQSMPTYGSSNCAYKTTPVATPRRIILVKETQLQSGDMSSLNLGVRVYLTLLDNWFLPLRPQGLALPPMLRLDVTGNQFGWRILVLSIPPGCPSPKAVQFGTMTCMYARYWIGRREDL